jgi:hypothetical protein
MGRGGAEDYRAAGTLNIPIATHTTISSSGIEVGFRTRSMIKLLFSS